MNDGQTEVPSNLFDGQVTVDPVPPASALEDTGVSPSPTAAEMPAMPVSDVAGWHPITIPSLGVYYDGKLPGGTIQISPWTTQQEETMARYGGTNPQAMMAALMRDNVRLAGGMTYEDLLITDQYFILTQLRAISLSRFMHAVVQCIFCKAEDEVAVNLNELIVKTPDEGDTEPFSFRLPKCKKTVTARFMRVKDVLAETAYSEQTGGEGLTRFRLARQIIEINGQSVKFDEKKDFVGALVLLDLKVLQRGLEDKETGILNEMSRTCSKCGKVEKDWVAPLSAGFFRLSDADLRAEVELAEKS